VESQPVKKMEFIVGLLVIIPARAQKRLKNKLIAVGQLPIAA